MKIKNRLKLAGLTALMYLPATCFAAKTGSYAWETVLSKITTSLTGPVAYSIAIIAIFACGLTMAFADLQGGAHRFVQAACGLSVAIFAAQIITGFLSFHGALI